MKKLYLVGYVISIKDELGGFGEMMGIKSGGDKFKFGNQKITTEKIDLPKLYSIIARKENTGIANVTILGVSLLD